MSSSKLYLKEVLHLLCAYLFVYSIYCYAILTLSLFTTEPNLSTRPGPLLFSLYDLSYVLSSTVFLFWWSRVSVDFWSLSSL